jgi:hypothetical protein
MIPEHLENALSLRKGDCVTHTTRSNSPRLSNKPYQLIDDPIPLFADARVPFEVRKISRNPNESQLCNVYFVIIDDTGKRVEVPYASFSNYTKTRVPSSVA